MPTTRSEVTHLNKAPKIHHTSKSQQWQYVESLFQDQVACCPAFCASVRSNERSNTIQYALLQLLCARLQPLSTVYAQTRKRLARLETKAQDFRENHDIFFQYQSWQRINRKFTNKNETWRWSDGTGSTDPNTRTHSVTAPVFTFVQSHPNISSWQQAALWSCRFQRRATLCWLEEVDLKWRSCRLVI